MVTGKLKGKAVRTLAVIKRNPRVEMRLELRRFDGVLYLDVRKFVALPGGAPCPTEKGAGFLVSELPALRDAIDAAIEETRE